MPTDALLSEPGCLRSLVDNLREVAFQTDAEGRWTFLNRAWEEITGFSVAESLGVPFLDFVLPEDRERNLEKFRPLIERQKDFCRHEVRYRTKDGGFRWIEVQARLTLDGDGSVTGTSGTLSDVTERRRTEDELYQARLRLELVLASNPAVIYGGRPSPDGAWHTTFMSGNCREMLGHPAEAFTADPPHWLFTIHPDDLERFYRSFNELESSGRTTVTCRARHADGSYRWLRSDTRLTTDSAGSPLEAFGCLVDETHTHEIEESLRSHAAILEAVAFAAQRFLDSGSWRQEIQAVMDRLGRAACTSRIFVCENEPSPPDDPRVSLRHEWTAPGIVSELANPMLVNISYRESGFGRWIEILRGGDPIFGNMSDFQPSERAFMEALGGRSALVVPVFAGTAWWGFIGLDEHSERTWSAAEVDALRAAAGILGAAIRREQAEAALHYEQILLRTMTEVSPFGFYVVDEHTDRVLYCNDRFCDIWGFRHLGDALRRGELSHKDLVPRCTAMVADHALAVSSASFDTCAPGAMHYIALRDGRTIRQFSTPIQDGADRYFGRFFLFEDVTEQKRIQDALAASHAELEFRVAERTAELVRLNRRLRGEISGKEAAQHALAERELRFRTIIENTSDVIFISGADAKVEYVSPPIASLLGYDPAEVVGRPGADLIHPADAQRAMAHFRQGLDVPGPHIPLEFRALHKDGSWRLVEAAGNNQLDNPAVRGIVVRIRDIADRRSLEEQFRQAQKMEAVGRLAGGVAHDFNNLLTVISGYSEIVARALRPQDPLSRNVGQIKRAADRATGLVQQLLAFSRKQVVEPTIIDMNDAVADLERMLRRLIGEDIDLVIAPAPEPIHVQIDRTQFDQIVMNLNVNARDAMPSGGTLTISVSHHRPLGRFECRTCRIAGGDFAVLEVRDTGSGMTEETRAHMFEPFFTTKEVGKGTGLGLSMVYGAVEQAGGHICVDTELGKGTAIRICLPRIEAPVPNSAGIKADAPEGGRETILLVEDEELVRAMVADTLTAAGFRLIEAHHPAHALELAALAESPIDLLLTDVIMPGMNGPELASRLAPMQPGAKVLYVSGYPRQERTPRGRFLKKPFTPDQLLHKIRAVLDD